MSVDISPVRPQDAETLLALARAFHAGEGRTLEAAAISALQQISHGEPLARAWLVRVSARPVGYLIITLGFSVEYGGRDGFIDDLYVAPEARGRGLGRLLVELACREAARLGIRTLHLEVEMQNARAASLYRSVGFAETGRRLMRKRISD